VKIASWTNPEHNELAPHEPEVTDSVVELKEPAAQIALYRKRTGLQLTGFLKADRAVCVEIGRPTGSCFRHM
jgi:hypothetical protein